LNGIITGLFEAGASVRLI